MNRFLLSLCLLAALLTTFAATPCVANTADGTIAQERVITLPQDQGKWYVSVVGDPQDARYREVLTWFDSGELLKLRNSVHYNIVPCRLGHLQGALRRQYADAADGSIAEPGRCHLFAGLRR